MAEEQAEVSEWFRNGSIEGFSQIRSKLRWLEVESRLRNLTPEQIDRELKDLIYLQEQIPNKASRDVYEKEIRKRLDAVGLLEELEVADLERYL